MKKRDRVYKSDKASTFYYSSSRRLFLRHLGGLISIPLLPSLLPRELWAQNADPNFYRKAVFMVNRHGGRWDSAEPTGIASNMIGNNILAGSLRSGKIGEIYNTDYEQVIDKITCIRGLDMATATSHSRCTALAASEHPYKDTLKNAEERDSVFPDTIDVVLGQSARVYPNAPHIRVLRFSPWGGSESHCFENGKIIFIPDNLQAIYDLVRSKIVIPDPGQGGQPSSGDNAIARKKLAMDSALLALNNTQKKRSISSSDKISLQQYQTLLESLRGDLGSDGGGPAPDSDILNSNTCQNISLSNGKPIHEQAAEIMVSALACGVTKLGYVLLQSEHDYVHGVKLDDNAQKHANYLRNTSLPMGGYMMRLMDQIQESNGKTLLDNSCVLMTSDLALSIPHNCLNMRVLVGGSLNGKLRTGQFIDYWNRAYPIRSGLTRGGSFNRDQVCGGRLYNELLVTILKSFGLTPGEYQRGGRKGFGTYECEDANFCRSLAGAGEALPELNSYLTNQYFKNSSYDRNSTLPYYYLG